MAFWCFSLAVVCLGMNALMASAMLHATSYGALLLSSGRMNLGENQTALELAALFLATLGTGFLIGSGVGWLRRVRSDGRDR